MKKIFVFNSKMLSAFLLMATLSLNLYSQEQPNMRARAKQYFALGEYAKAALLYEKLVDKKKIKTDDLEQIAACYLYINQYERAENWYVRAVEKPDHQPVTQWNYALALKQNGKYDAAKAQFENYKSKYGSSDKLALEIAGADSAIVWMANPKNISIKNEKAINSATTQFGAYPINSQKVLYAGEPENPSYKLSGMTGNAFLKLFTANIGSDGLSLADHALLDGEMNNASYHVGPVSASPTGDTLFVTRTYPGKSVEKFKQDGLRFKKHNLELIIYTREGNNWKAEAFPYNDVKKYSLGHASLSKDGKTLYFASDMPGGIGGVDIWSSTVQVDGTWATPKNLGATVNSTADEVFPMIQGNRLYYASNGFAGMGGLDIYAVKWNGEVFTDRENLKYPINTASDDFSYVLFEGSEHERKGYLSSNRIGGAGADDIYAFNYSIAPIKVRLEGTTVNKVTNELLPSAAVYLFDDANALVAKRNSDEKGFFSFDINQNMQYNLRAEKTGFHEDKGTVAPVVSLKDSTVFLTLRLQPVLTIGDKFVLEDIYYDFDKHAIRKDAAIILNKLVRTMRDNPTLRIELSSHTDSRGNDQYNDKLSQRRAQSAVDYLVTQGIDRDRLVAKGYGERKLVNHCANGVSCSPAEHQANRRTEIEVLSY